LSFVDVTTILAFTLSLNHITSHREDGSSRPQGPLYPNNNTKNIDYTTSE